MTAALATFAVKLIPLCAPWNVFCKIAEKVEQAAKWAFGFLVDIVYDFVTMIITEAVKLVMKTVGTLWLDVPNPNVSDGNNRPTPVIEFMQGRIMWLAVACATVSLIVAGMRMAWSMRGDSVRSVGKSLLTFTIVSGLGVGIVGLLNRIANDFSDWIIAGASGGDSFDSRIDRAFDADYGDAKLVFVLFIGLAAIITSIIQIALMFVRNGMVILLLGVLPLAAAATNTEMGKAWFRKLVGWLAAFLAYKPLAALIYGAAMTMMGSSSGWKEASTGVAMMVMAVIALPALLRFVSPNTGG
jgi:hypothetical protein